MSYCHECGNELLNDAKFCTRCGCRTSQLNPIKTLKTESTPTIQQLKNPLRLGVTKLYLTIACIAILSITNPKEIDFQIFMNQEINNRIPNEQGQTDFLTQLFQGSVKNMLADYISNSSSRSNYLIFSIYTVNLGGLKNYIKDAPASLKFIGILGQFIPLSKN